MIRFKHKGNFKNTEALFGKIRRRVWVSRLQNLAHLGVTALRNATPVDSGITAASWTYDIIETDKRVSIVWSNTNVNALEGRYEVNIAVILQYGHATRNGGWVEGRDYINPAIQPVFDKIVDDAWEVIISK